MDPYLQIFIFLVAICVVVPAVRTAWKLLMKRRQPELIESAAEPEPDLEHFVNRDESQGNVAYKALRSRLKLFQRIMLAEIMMYASSMLDDTEMAQKLEKNGMKNFELIMLVPRALKPMTPEGKKVYAAVESTGTRRPRRDELPKLFRLLARNWDFLSGVCQHQKDLRSIVEFLMSDEQARRVLELPPNLDCDSELKRTLQALSTVHDQAFNR